MGDFHVVLADHGVVHSCVDACMAKELLNLFDGHAFVDCTGGEGSAEFVRMDLVEAQPLPHFSQADFNATDLQTIMGL